MHISCLRLCHSAQSIEDSLMLTVQAPLPANQGSCTALEEL